MSSPGAGSHGGAAVASVKRAGGGGVPPDPAAKQLNKNFASYLFIILGSIAFGIILWRIVEKLVKIVRHVSTINDDKQRYFAIPSAKIAALKRHVLYAPVFSKRHNREFQLSKAVNVGTLPTRFQLAFITTYFIINVAFCCIDLPYAEDVTIAATQIRNRSGMMATANLIPLFILAGRNNPLIPLLGISFDTYNLIHRWLGRIVVLESIVHTLAHFAKGKWTKGTWDSTFVVPFIMWGFIATCAFVALGLHSPSPLRHAFYEIFKVIHIAMAILALIGLWYHLKLAELWHPLKFLYVAVAFWSFDRGTRIIRILRSHLGGSRSRTVIEALPGNAIRLTMTMARPWSAKPGQHAYLYMPSISFWQSHPFSVSWVDGGDDVSSETTATHQEVVGTKQMEVSYIIRARTGFTENLYKKALLAPGGRMETSCFAEGPYGGHHVLDSYGTVVLFAGGVGITHQVPYVRHLVAGFAEGTVSTKKVLLVWTIQSPEHLEWIRPWMTEILAMDKRRDVLRIMLFVSQPKSTKEIHSPSSTVQMFPGRPNIDTLLAMEQEQQVGAMVVTVCGPGALSDEVRRSVRVRQDRSSIDFIEEAFTW